nr:hypothetical protein [Leptosphaeria biglobosa ambi-like virus 1]
MPYIYFGFRPRNRGPTKLVVSTPRGDMEPVEPSKIKVYTKATYSPVWSLLSSVLGLVVSVLSYPKFTYTALVTEGSRPKAATTPLPFRKPGIAVPFAKGAQLSEVVTQGLEEDGFQSMQFMGRLVWLKENGTKEDYLKISSLGKVDSSGGVPARFMNPDSFKSYLTLLSLATRISQTMHRLAGSGNSSKDMNPAIVKRSELGDGWMSMESQDESDDTPTVTNETPKFIKSEVYLADRDHEKIPASIILAPGSTSGPSRTNSGVVYNAQSGTLEGFIKSGRISALNSHGLIFKFNPRLALPDPNLIGDILGRHFLLCLGGSTEEQFENLHFLKSGLSSLRLTKLGDELTHMFKCIEIAIGTNSGCVPFFTGSTYEGCVVMGGPEATISINGENVPFLPATTLKDEFLNVSAHATALSNISNCFTGSSVNRVRSITSMVELRSLCLTLEATQDVRDNIIRAAVDLEFELDEWVVNPANLRAVFNLISDLSSLKAETHPIGRMALFTKDPVLVALSCFGEKSCPTWDIPNGTQCSLQKPNPPSPPSAPRGQSKKGDISDAAWVMVVRYTDLFSAVDEFKRMAATLTYKSTSSVIAKRVGHRVFSRDRMAEFWKELREALRHVNPNAKFEVDSDVLKRKRDGDGGSGPVGEGAKRAKGLDF